MRCQQVVYRQENISMGRGFLLMIILAGCNHEPSRFGFGRAATMREIDSLNISITPDGKGLPKGSGNVAAGQVIYTSRCAVCHGATGTEVSTNRLVAVFGDTVKAKT